MRMVAIHALGEFGPVAKEALPALQKLAEGDVFAGSMRVAVAEAIERIRR